MEGKSKLTQEEKRLKRIAQLKAMLQQEEAKQNQEERKRRTGQLVAFGVYFEEFFRISNEETRKRLEESIKSTFPVGILTGHWTALNGFLKNKKIPAPPVKCGVGLCHVENFN